MLHKPSNNQIKASTHKQRIAMHFFQLVVASSPTTHGTPTSSYTDDTSFRILFSPPGASVNQNQRVSFSTATNDDNEIEFSPRKLLLFPDLHTFRAEAPEKRRSNAIFHHFQPPKEGKFLHWQATIGLAPQIFLHTIFTSHNRRKMMRKMQTPR